MWLFYFQAVLLWKCDMHLGLCLSVLPNKAWIVLSNFNQIWKKFLLFLLQIIYINLNLEKAFNREWKGP